jgi:hypothetical protein
MPHVRRVAFRRRCVPVPGMVVAVPAALAGYAIGEAACAKSFQVQTSDDTATWTTIYSTTTGTGGGCGTTNAALNRPVSASSTENAGTPATAAVDGNAGTRWSSAFSDPHSTTTGTGGTPPVQGGGSLGPNVIVYEPSMSDASIQSSVDTAFDQMQSNQFGSQRYALLFKPGSLSAGFTRWAVAQAAPLRRAVAPRRCAASTCAATSTSTRTTRSTHRPVRSVPELPRGRAGPPFTERSSGG